MKQLMLGNEAVARGLYEAGCSVVSSYPGTPSTEITEAAAKYEEIYAEWAPNEKVAMETAFGAALAGARSFCAMKHVGMNVAADPMFTLSYTGVTGGMVIAVADDPGMHSSQNEQDSRHYALAAKLPMLEPSDSAEALAFTKAAFELSEKFDTAVILKLCTRVSHSQSVVETSDRVDHIIPDYVKNGAKYIMTPANAIKRHPAVEERTKALAEFAESCSLNRIEEGADKSFGIVTSSGSYNYVKEAFGDKYPVLKLGMIWPMPEKLIKNFAAGIDKAVVVEELDPFIENQLKAWGILAVGKEKFSMLGELSQNKVREAFDIKPQDGTKLDAKIPVRPPAMCSGCPHRGLFYTLKKLKLNVFGDIGCYTLGSAQPLGAMDSTLCMGGSITTLHGFNKALGEKASGKSVAVIGDSTFAHSGMTGLTNVAYNNSASCVIILDNSITGMTGHQQNPTTGKTLKGDLTSSLDLEAFCRAIGIKRVTVVDPYDLAQCEEVISREAAADEPSVVISRRPCVLLKSVKMPGPILEDREKCKGCRLCMSIGCPSISMKDGKVSIDQTLCVGCNVCTQLCRFGALGGEAK